MNPTRSQKLNRFIVKGYFSKLKVFIMLLDILDRHEHIYSIGEKQSRLLSINKEPKVLAQKGSKRFTLLPMSMGRMPQ
jgi:hypothetical protein